MYSVSNLWADHSLLYFRGLYRYGAQPASDDTGSTARTAQRLQQTPRAQEFRALSLFVLQCNFSKTISVDQALGFIVRVTSKVPSLCCTLGWRFEEVHPELPLAGSIYRLLLHTPLSCAAPFKSTLCWVGCEFVSSGYIIYFVIFFSTSRLTAES